MKKAPLLEGNPERGGVREAKSNPIPPGEPEQRPRRVALCERCWRQTPPANTHQGYCWKCYCGLLAAYHFREADRWWRESQQ
jgi:hypothetical protein